MLTITVHDTPAPQGSKRHVGHGVMIESSKQVKPWREAVKHAALEALRDSPQMVLNGAVESHAPIEGPVSVEVLFVLARPKGHYRTGKNAHLLRTSAPARPAGKPDVDKLLRSTLDALTAAGVWRDDSQVVTLTGHKAYPEQHLVAGVLHRFVAPGAIITVRGLPATIADANAAERAA